MKECEICHKSFCFCKHRKFTATITHKFEGSKEAEVNKRLRNARSKMGSLDLKASVGSYPYSANKNRYDKALIDEAVSKLASLMINYSYSEEETEKVIAGLMDSVNAEVSQHYQEMEADRVYEEMKEEQAFSEGKNDR